MTNHVFFRRWLGLLALLVILAGCGAEEQPAKVSSEESAEAAHNAELAQPVRLTGAFNYTNDIFLTYHRTHAVALIDLHGFVLRDVDWEVPLSSIVFGRLEIDHEHSKGTYTLDLPLRPEANLSDTDHDQNSGVKVYAVTYWPEPYASDDAYYGWPNYISSLRTDSERGNEITGGKLLVWSPNDQQSFPTNSGPDKQLFTADDPLQPLKAGYSIVDLDTPTYTISREAQPTLDLYETSEYSTKDFSDLSYTEAFEKLFAQMRRDYAFNGILDKQPDWDAVYKKISAQVTQAQTEKDPKTFFVAIRALVNSLHDGHSSINGGDLEDKLNEEMFGGGFGFAVRELDDGQFLVTYVKKDGPADLAGLKTGTFLTEVDGKPVLEAMSAVQPPNGPFSTRLAQRYEQLRYLTRAPVGTTISWKFSRPGSDTHVFKLKAVDEYSSLQVTSLYRGVDPSALPVEYWMLDSNIGYVRINSNDDDNIMIDELFRRALDSFEYNEAESFIIDMRQNDGGTNLGLAGYLTKDKIPLARLEYFNAESQEFDAVGPTEQVWPSDNPYQFQAIALLVGPACYSACEIEAYGFSQLPNAIVVGETPSAGVVAEVAQGAFKLPENIQIQMPTGRYMRNGELFLEGNGVTPTLRVPVNRENALADGDVVLQAAEDALTK